MKVKFKDLTQELNKSAIAGLAIYGPDQESLWPDEQERQDPDFNEHLYVFLMNLYSLTLASALLGNNKYAEECVGFLEKILTEFNLHSLKEAGIVELTRGHMAVLNEESEVAHRYLKEAYSRLKQTDSSKKATIYFHSAKACFLLGTLCMEIGKTDEAKIYYKEFYKYAKKLYEFRPDDFNSRNLVEAIGFYTSAFVDELSDQEYYEMVLDALNIYAVAESTDIIPEDIMYGLFESVLGIVEDLIGNNVTDTDDRFIKTLFKIFPQVNRDYHLSPEVIVNLFSALKAYLTRENKIGLLTDLIASMLPDGKSMSSEEIQEFVTNPFSLLIPRLLTQLYAEQSDTEEARKYLQLYKKLIEVVYQKHQTGQVKTAMEKEIDLLESLIDKIAAAQS